VPGGKARIGSEYVDVLTRGEVVEPGVRVRVVEVLGNHILVEAIV
jgi:hypothetical protein